ncbi:zinc knuckle CX2CX4HX4C containing protein [Tanacetum coccineum]
MEKTDSLLSSFASKVQNIDGSTKPVSFALILKEKITKKTVNLVALTNDEIVQGAHLAIPLVSVEENYVKNAWAKYGNERVMLNNGFFFQISTKEGMDKVLENGPWLIRLVPIILNVWTPNSRLKKDEKTTVPVWVKLYNVPIVAYSEIGLSLITTKLGRPIMLDAYTSNMCLNSWGRNTYARALIEVSSETALMDSLVVTIPFQDGSGHTMETIDIDYEWQPPRCDTCKIFDHNDDQCPKKLKVAVTNQDDGFVEVTHKHGKGKQNSKPRHIDGVRLTKPKPNYYYRPVSKPVNVNDEASTSQPKENKEPFAPNPNNKGKDVSDLQEINVVSLQNSFDALMEKDKIIEVNNEPWEATNDIGSKMDDSEEVENVFVKDNGKHMNDLVDDARKKVEAPPKKTLLKET